MDKKSFIKFGFTNQNDYRLLNRKTKRLIRKYPKNKQKSSKTKKAKIDMKPNKSKQNTKNSLSQIEGIIEDTLQ